MMQESKTLRSALWYRNKLGWSVIPQKPNKHPYIAWEKYQYELPRPEEIREWFTHWPNAMIGIVTGKLSGITVIDIDTKAGMERMEDLLPEGFRSPSVRTPRGGRHIYFKYTDKLVSRSRDLPDIDTKNDGGVIVAPPSVNENGRTYEWVDCLHVMRTPMAEVPLKYIEAVSRFREQRYPNLDIGDIEVGFDKGGRDETLFHVAYNLIKGGMAPDNVEKVLDRLASACHPPFPKHEAKIKVRSAVERAFKKDRNLPKEVHEWVSVTTGVFSVTDIYSALHLVTPEEKSYARQILRRLREANVVETYGTRADVYRRVQSECVVMDYRNAQVQPIDINWPLGIGDFFVTYAKNICVIAGTKDAGKTAFFLDFIKRNQDRHEIHYYNSEMASEELRMRLEKHEDIQLSDWQFTAYERTENFADTIKPDAINIIDYLEINREFCEIGDRIREIHEKLGKGIAIVGIQKDFGATYGRGRAFSMQRPRLYITMERGLATVLVAKNRRDPSFNPIGMERKYKIINGWKLVPVEDWHDAEANERNWFKG